MPTIEIFVDDETGESTISVDGVKGEGCVGLTADIEERFFGGTDDRKLTSEYADRPEVNVNNHLRAGR